MNNFDWRKNFILSIAGNYFTQSVTPDLENEISQDKYLNNFLEDTGCFILSMKCENESFTLDNKLPPGDGQFAVLVFFKTRPEAVTEENLRQIVYVTSMPDSPLVALYQALRHVFAPTLLKDESWCEKIEPRLQSILNELQVGLLNVVLRKENPVSSSASLAEIITIEDELQFWAASLNEAKKKNEKEKCKAFMDAIRPLINSVKEIEVIELSDTDDVLDTAHNALDDLWKLDEYQYPQDRMQHLMETVGKTLARFIQRKLKSEAIWETDFIEVESLLNQGLGVCHRWIQTCEKLTTLFWPNYSLHRWTGLPYRPAHLAKFSMRLKEILNVRTVDRQLTRLLTQDEQAQLDVATNFKPFSGVSSVHYNAYTEGAWSAAISQFRQRVEPAERRVAEKLRHQLRHSHLNTLQLLQEFSRYREIVERPTIRQALQAERERLLAALTEYVATVQVDPTDAQLKMADQSPIVGRLLHTTHMLAKVNDIEKISDAILGDLGGYPGLKRDVDNLKRELKECHSTHLETWTRETSSAVRSRTLGLKTDEPVVHFEQGKLMLVNYDPRLVTLVTEVRQLAAMGCPVPDPVRDAAATAGMFVRQARKLQQVATFHNTIGDRMIASQRPMMLAAALELARLVREQHRVTWSDMTAVDAYADRLQAAVDRLYKENNQLSHWHAQLVDKVVVLMGTDLLKHQQQWKNGLAEIRELMANVEVQFNNSKSWRAHWDHQLYKALDHQYRRGLRDIHKHMTEIKVDVVYRQQKLQLSPPLEELRMKYYGALKRFLSLPLSFRGLCDTPIFNTVVDRNGVQFAHVYARAEALFARLEGACDEWRDAVALGSVDVDALCRDRLLSAADWDANFRASKAWSQQIAKMVTSERKIDCFVLNVAPVCNEIEVHNRCYWDSLASSLYASVQADAAAVDRFMRDARAKLTAQPERPADAHAIYSDMTTTANEMQGVLDEMQKKNQTLASWTKERVEQVTALSATWDNFLSDLANYQQLIAQQVEMMKARLVASVDSVASSVDRFKLRWDEFKPKEETLTSGDLQKGLDTIRAQRLEWDQLMVNVDTLREEHKQFELEPPELPLVGDVESDLRQYEDTWALLDTFNTDVANMANEEWIVFRGKAQMKLTKFIDDWSEKLSQTETTALTVLLHQELDHFKDFVPALKLLRGDAFSEAHWVELLNALHAPVKPLQQLMFGDFLQVKHNVKANIETLKELNSRASSEVVIRQALAELDVWEVDTKFSTSVHTDCKGRSVQLITGWTDVMTKVGDHQCLLQSIRSAANYGSFADRAGLWETRLAQLDGHLRQLSQAQRKWVYLEPVVGGVGVERGRFERADRDLRLVLGDLAAADFRVMALCRLPHLSATLHTMLQQLAHCQKSLIEYLEEKRLRFPRFYFLGDEDLLEILGQSSKEHVVQAHLKKLFAGIYSVVFRDGKIIAMQSLQGETVELSTGVRVTQDVEEWLGSLTQEMKGTLRGLVRECVAGPADPLRFPSQALCLAERIGFTGRCERAIRSASLPDLLNKLQSQLSLYTASQLESSHDVVLGLKLKALQLDVIHHIDVVRQLVSLQVSSLDDWHWQRRLRFYAGRDGAVSARMVDAEFEYSYEYQGNSAQLVHTPLTDKCYLTLTQAMSMGLGGNPYGPAGTGKTESVKALGALLGRQVLVFNCDEGIDVKALTRILVGLVKCGAWGCFDEFNRLEEATLSAISMQIHPVQEALRKGSPMVTLMGQQVEVDRHTGIFVTLNPAGQGYAGRQRLPDNLKQLFRPVVMSRPDDALIAQVILHCEGFTDANRIGSRLATLFQLARELLSQQHHYDWGLRALKTVVGACGSARAANLNTDSKEEEVGMVVRVLRLNTLSRLTAADRPRFDQLIEDTFPGARLAEPTHWMRDTVQTACDKLSLQYTARQEQKALELHEQIRQRMGVVVVGPSGSGKSTVIKLLKNSSVREHVISPKALSHAQLLGHTDPDTGQWVDGVLSSIAQTVYGQPPDVECWVVFDGDVDPKWIEALNSVLDDNRLLTLPSGQRIQFGPNVHFLFETHDLANASPATISRMGMVLMSWDDLELKSIVDAWLLNQPPDVVVILSNYIEEYFYRGVQWVVSNGETVLPMSPANIVYCGLSLMASVVSRAHFTASLALGLGSSLTSSSRQTLIQQVAGWTGELLPDSGSSPLHLRYDARHDCVDSCLDEPPMEGQALVITAQMSCATEVLVAWIREHKSFILVGPSGSAKSLLLDNCFRQLSNTDVATVHCSAQITPSHVVQKLSQVCMVVSSSGGRVYRPSKAHRLAMVLRDVNIVANDQWGANALAAWLHQIQTYGGFYDMDREWVRLENVMFIFSVSSTENLSPRFVANNLVYSLSGPEKSDLWTICAVTTKAILPPSLNKMASVLSQFMVSVYLEVKDTFANKDLAHYILTPADLGAWCGSLKRYSLTDKQALLEAVTYEALRQFGDRLVSMEDKSTLYEALSSAFERDFGGSLRLDDVKGIVFMSESAVVDGPLLRMSVKDCALVTLKTLNQLGREEAIVEPELVARVERVLSRSGGSLSLVGRSGVGRKTALSVVAARLSASVITPTITHSYGLHTFKTDLKHAMQVAGLEGEQVIFVLEDFQLINSQFLDLINGLLSSGEVQGLYQPEELEATAAVLREDAAQAGFDGNVSQYFASRVQRNLHVALVLESSSFTDHCRLNPALLKRCSLLWLDQWTTDTMASVPRNLLTQMKFTVNSDCVVNILDQFRVIHESCADVSDSSPKRYLAFVCTFLHIYEARVSAISDTQAKLQAGVTKLTSARNTVDTLKAEAAEQERRLAERQAEANAALEAITATMGQANVHRADMDRLRDSAQRENQTLQIRKKEIEAELVEIEPLVEEARAAVGNIKTEALSEIRSLRAPPEVIRDILEGVLSLMGIQDTSWNSMKTFLAKRGVKEDIRCFDARSITSESRATVEALLDQRRDSFSARTAKRASQAAAPLAAWVTANVQFSRVLEKIRPLEREQSALTRNLESAEARIGELSGGLESVDRTVAELKDRLARFTREAAELEVHLGRAQETISGAHGLVTRLSEEYHRWQAQLTELSESLRLLPKHCLLAAAFIAYLAPAPQEVRKKKVEQWCQLTGLSDFSLTKLLSSERQLMLWQSQGLAVDQLSAENAAIITTVAGIETHCQKIFILDPSSTALHWLKKSLAESNAEVVSQASPRFHTSFDLAIRFGKKLIVEDVDCVEPYVFGMFRAESHGSRLYLVSRNSVPLGEPYVQAALCQVNFTTTQAGLTEQLVQATLKLAQPQLEQRRLDLLRREEELTQSLDQLQDNVLQQLANATGDILQNKELMDSLNETKRSSEAIAESLAQSGDLRAALSSECNTYRPLAQLGGRLFAAISRLSHLNNMYRMSTAAFLRLYQRTLANTPQDMWQEGLVRGVFHHVARGLFKQDVLPAAVLLARATRPDLTPEPQWETLVGRTTVHPDGMTARSPLPNWVPAERASALARLQNALPDLWSELQMERESAWSSFPLTEPPVALSPFQRVLLTQALRPDLLHSALDSYAQLALGVSGLSPPPLRLSQLLSETSASEPVLILTGGGTDPGSEIQALALQQGRTYHEVALGEGQEAVVNDLLASTALEGHWLCLKNLHLMTSWLPSLEKRLQTLCPAEAFRLWLTSEPHVRFPSSLVTACLKVTYEAPRGVKRNLQRTYASWEGEGVARPQFALAWFHAVVQERRTYAPQGWVKLYEFNDSDLQAALHVLKRRLATDGGHIRWEVVHGLIELAVYGGRVDNFYDLRVLGTYLKEYFNSSVCAGSGPLAPGVTVPHSTTYQDHLRAIERLPDEDSHSVFGMAANMRSAWQRRSSQLAADKLTVLSCDINMSESIQRQAWQSHLAPTLNLWKKLNQGTGFIKMRLGEAPSDLGPVEIYLAREFRFGIGLVQTVHSTLSAVSRVLKGAAAPGPSTLPAIDSLMRGQTPECWLAEWAGPTAVNEFLSAIIDCVSSLAAWQHEAPSRLNLAKLFHPQVYFSSLRHQAARKQLVGLDQLCLVNSWKGKGGEGGVALEGLQLEGSTVAGSGLAPATPDSPDVFTAPPLYAHWTAKQPDYDTADLLAVPLYLTASREVLVSELQIPCPASDRSTFILAGTAFYIRN